MSNVSQPTPIMCIVLNALLNPVIVATSNAVSLKYPTIQPIQHHKDSYYDAGQLQYRNFIPLASHDA